MYRAPGMDAEQVRQGEWPITRLPNTPAQKLYGDTGISDALDSDYSCFSVCIRPPIVPLKAAAQSNQQASDRLDFF